MSLPSLLLPPTAQVVLASSSPRRAMLLQELVCELDRLLILGRERRISDGMFASV